MKQVLKQRLLIIVFMHSITLTVIGYNDHCFTPFTERLHRSTRERLKATSISGSVTVSGSLIYLQIDRILGWSNDHCSQSVIFIESREHNDQSVLFKNLLNSAQMLIVIGHFLNFSTEWYRGGNFWQHYCQSSLWVHKSTTTHMCGAADAGTWMYCALFTSRRPHMLYIK